jgi:hypothetical protein
MWNLFYNFRSNEGSIKQGLDAHNHEAGGPKKKGWQACQQYTQPRLIKSQY